MVYFITFHTYGTWLTGQEKGSVDRAHNKCNEPFLTSDPLRELGNYNRLLSPPLKLNAQARRIVADQLIEVALYKKWIIHAAHVRTTHVHIIVSAQLKPEPVMNAFKSWATRRLRESNTINQDLQPWARHGSTPFLESEAIIQEKIRYVLFEQGKALERILDNRILSYEFCEADWLRAFG